MTAFELHASPAVTKHDPIVSFDKYNVLGHLNASIARHGGPDQTYHQHVSRVLKNLPAEVLNYLVTRGNCFYVTPELQLHGTEDPADYRIVTKRVFTPRHEDIKPICLIGCVLVDAGVPMAVFQEKTSGSDTDPNSAKCNRMLDLLVARGLVDCDLVASAVLREAQARQDSKESWGAAFTGAVHVHASQIRQAERIDY